MVPAWTAISYILIVLVGESLTVVHFCHVKGVFAIKLKRFVLKATASFAFIYWPDLDNSATTVKLIIDLHTHKKKDIANRLWRRQFVTKLCKS